MAFDLGRQAPTTVDHHGPFLQGDALRSPQRLRPRFTRLDSERLRPGHDSDVSNETLPARAVGGDEWDKFGLAALMIPSRQVQPLRIDPWAEQKTRPGQTAAEVQQQDQTVLASRTLAEEQERFV